MFTARYGLGLLNNTIPFSPRMVKYCANHLISFHAYLQILLCPCFTQLYIFCNARFSRFELKAFSIIIFTVAEILAPLLLIPLRYEF